MPSGYVKKTFKKKFYPGWIWVCPESRLLHITVFTCLESTNLFVSRPYDLANQFSIFLSVERSSLNESLQIPGQYIDKSSLSFPKKGKALCIRTLQGRMPGRNLCFSALKP